jgi:hypothetical protein
LTSDPKYFETCLTSLYSYITYHTDKHKPFTQILLTKLEQIHLSCHKYQRQHLKHKQRSDKWIKISQRETAALITEEREKLLKPFERPRFPLPDFPSITRIILGPESINKLHYFCQDPRPIPDTRKKWKSDLYIQNKEREWHILSGVESQRQGTGKPFNLKLWENLDKIDLTQLERSEH